MKRGDTSSRFAMPPHCRAARPSRCGRSGGGDAPACHHRSSLRPSGCGRLFLHVAAWGRLDLGVLVVARRLRRGYLLAAGLGEPFVPGRPPAAGDALRGVQPLVGVGVVRSAVRADPAVARGRRWRRRSPTCPPTIAGRTDRRGSPQTSAMNWRVSKSTVATLMAEAGVVARRNAGGAVRPRRTSPPARRPTGCAATSPRTQRPDVPWYRDLTETPTDVGKLHL